MKAKHLKTVKTLLPPALPEIQAIIQNTPGLEDFVLDTLKLRHKDDIIGCSNPNEEPCKIWNGKKYVWQCVPLGTCP